MLFTLLLLKELGCR